MKFIKYNIPFLILYIFLLILVIVFSSAGHSLAQEEAENNYESEILVGLAELYYGSNSIKGNLELIEDNDDFAEEVDMGRIAFYLQGKIKGKYLITAWLDTEEQKLDQLFKNLDERKKESPFEKIDAEKYYPVYGDNSSSSSEVNTAGKLYLALESDTFRALWGNSRINYDQNSLINLSKSIYGLNLSYDNRVKAEYFLQQPFTVRAQDELELTGGLLYYLNNDDITAGSESIELILKDAETNRKLESKMLKAGIDYEINYLQGRIILKNRPELDEELIESAQGEDTYSIIVNYEYDYDSDNDNYSNYGFKLSFEITDKLIIRGTKIKEELGEDDYILEGLSLNYLSGKGTTLQAEWAESEKTGAGRYFSDDGGLTYSKKSISSDWGAEAYNIELEHIFNDKFSAASYYTDKEAGFNSNTNFLEEDQQNYGIEAVYSGKKFKNTLSFEESTRGEIEKDILSFKTEADYSLKNSLSFELKNIYQEDDGAAGRNDLAAAVGIEHKLDSSKSIYASQQFSLDSNSGDYNITTIGGRAEYDKWSFNTEAEAGDKESFSFGSGYRINENNEIYSEMEKDFTETSTINTVGVNSKINDKTDIYGEYRAENSGEQREYSNVVGIDYSPLLGLLMSLDYTKSDVIDSSEQDFKREIIGLGTSYSKNNLKSLLRLEYRQDQKTETLEQFFLKSNFRWKQSAALSYLAAVEYSQEKEAEKNEYLDADIGFAYRPVKQDRLNVLAMYTYLKEESYLNDEDQFGRYPAERSQVFALDFIYELTPKWELTEKLAYKNGEVKLNSLDKDWTSSETYLWVNRLNYQLRNDINLFGEYRILENTLAEDRKSGFLLGAYKRFDNNLKLGAGYNFTDFNDDLTDLSYEAEGWFINIIKAW